MPEDMRIHFGWFLYWRVSKSGKTQDEIALSADISTRQLQRIFKQEVPGSYISTIARIAQAMGTDYDTLDSAWRETKVRQPPRRGVTDRPDNNVEPYSERKLTVDPPLFELTIHASRWDELRPDDDEGGEVATAQQIEQGVFLARIRGDCMEPKWRDELVIAFRLLRNESGRPDFSQMRVGGSYYVQLGSGEATFKALAEDSEEEIVLMPLNPKYKKQRLRAVKEDVARLAVAIE